VKLVGRGHPLDREYWRRRWREGRIGFHQEAIDPHLLRHLPGLADRVGAAHPPLRTLVPLCGKSRDLLWLGEEGHRVTGVEIAPEACALCASEQQLSPLSPPAGAERAWRRDLPGGGRLDLLQGDILDLPTPSPDGEGDAGPGWDLIWDRAALIALQLGPLRLGIEAVDLRTASRRGRSTASIPRRRGPSWSATSRTGAMGTSRPSRSWFTP